jgi:hypothetical protein
MVERSQQIGFTLKVLNNGLPNERIWRGIDHLLNRNQFDDIGEMQITGTVNRPHPPDPNHILNQIALEKRSA